MPSASFLRCNALTGALWVVLLLVDAVLGTAAGPPDLQTHQQARQILQATGVSGGLIVHLGCGDGRLTAALAGAAEQGCVVQGLDCDVAAIEQARRYLRSLGLYGRVSVGDLSGPRLPYADNTVNLLFCERPELLARLGIEQAELLRVLVPGGVAYLKQQDRWLKRVKPWPAEIDQWTHYLHDASNNAVAHDRLVGPPRRLQWTASPPHMRSHEHIPGLYALVSSGGRIFYIVDQAPVASIRCQPRWHLVARDAFNGVLLWQRPLEDWFPHIVNWGQTPQELQRRLVAVDDRLFVTLGLHAPVSVIDARTGRKLAEYENTAGTQEIIRHRGTLLLVIRRFTPEARAELEKFSRLLFQDDSPLFQRESATPFVERLRQSQRTGELRLCAFEAETGRLRWQKRGAETSGLRPNSLCAAGDRVFYQKGRDVVCLDLQSGKTLWTVPCSTLFMAADQKVFCSSAQAVTALAVADGRELWTAPTGLVQVRDLFLAGGSLWAGGFKPFPSKRSPAWGPYFAVQLDPATGKRLREVAEENPGHHHRCYRNKATDRYIFAGRRGTELIELNSGEVLWHSWARGVCRYGVMPCNGLLYAPPHACGCYMTAKLMGFNALAPASDGPASVGSATAARTAPAAGRLAKLGRPASEAARLHRGPAYADAPLQKPSEKSAVAWPTYRADIQRSGHARSALDGRLVQVWQTKLGAKLTPPTADSERLLVAVPEEHRVVALDLQTGRATWDFTAGARVDSPPTFFAGRAIFGCRDGCVYSLRAADGVLAWRLQAARSLRRIVADGQVESAWPLHGSVLVHEGRAYFTAGRSSYLDGGVDLCCVDAVSGENLQRTTLYSPDPQTGRQPPQFGPADMPGTRSDVLSGDGKYVFLGQMVFDPKGVRQADGPAHLFAMTGFLDDSWPHRSYWIFGTKWSAALGCSGRARQLIYGRLLVFDEKTIYGYGRDGVHWSNQLQDGPYRLFAIRRGEAAPSWTARVPITVRAMLLAGKTLFVAGPAQGPRLWACKSPEQAQSWLLAVSAADGKVLAQYELPACPVFDGMAAAAQRLVVSLADGSVVCFAAR